MATGYPRYEMRDGKTRLGQEYFNPVFKDLDTRLDTLEKMKWAVDDAIQQLQEFGLDRIDATVAPVLAEAQAMLTESQAILTDLQSMIADADIPALIAAAMAPLVADVNEALEAQNDSFTESINTMQEDLDAVRTLAYAGL
jgi:methyl-accepting chemotaxis protein